MAHAPPHLHDLAAARALLFRMRDTAGRAPWQSSALPKGYQPPPRPTPRQKALKARQPRVPIPSFGTAASRLVDIWLDHGVSMLECFLPQTLTEHGPAWIRTKDQGIMSPL